MIASWLQPYRHGIPRRLFRDPQFLRLISNTAATDAVKCSVKESIREDGADEASRREGKREMTGGGRGTSRHSKSKNYMEVMSLRAWSSSSLMALYFSFWAYNSSIGGPSVHGRRRGGGGGGGGAGKGGKGRKSM